ncbi:DUF4843 domain-containing protein [Pedobacter nutrimenti]|uniref:DUF4843 domain-containing protein n=1 Tax=Pedobacter nutrimenti TaxID=1241337 RepID=UPI00292D5C44|nr:DUF4843 domain-containing protein [Pedobacter nutrimenti]
MNKLIYRIALLFIAVSLVSCQKDLMTFDNKQADVYFSDAGKALPTLAYDSLYVSFAYSKSQDSVRNIVVAATGSKVDHDRTYQVAVDPSSTAIAGTHFAVLSQKFVIKANTQADTIKLKLVRTPEMQTTSYFVVLNLLPNENFGTSFKSRLVSSKSIKTISTKILFNDIVRKPGKWSDAYFGAFSRKKLFFMCDFLEITPQYIDTDITISEITALSKLVQRHLNQLGAAGNPVYEDDGVTLIKMGASAQ